MVERLIQSKYSPDAVVINAEMQILQFRGHTAPYLDPTPGEASLNLLRIAKESIVLPLRRAIQKAMESNALVREPGLSVEINGLPEEVCIEVTPVSGGSPQERCFLVVFVRRASREAPEVTQTLGPSSPVDEQVAFLQRELADTREHLRSPIEQYEAHSEELRAANEESRSANEERQSRNQEMVARNSDLRNLLAAVNGAIVMVDQDLRVLRFNPATERLLELGPVDIGRPVGHLRGRIEAPRLEDQVRKVIDTLSAMSEEVQDHEGCWYAVGIRPYRTVDDRIAGAVVTFQNIDALKRELESSEEARQYAEALVETVREPLVVLDADLHVLRATPAFYETFLVSREETEGRLLYDLGNGHWNRPRLRELLGSALFRFESFHDFEVEHEFPHIGRRIMRLNARRIPRRQPRQRTLVLAIEDVTGRREIAEIRFQRLFETAKDGMVVIDGETQTVQYVNPFFLRLAGLRREDIAGRSVADSKDALCLPGMAEIVAATRDSEIVRRDDLQLSTRDGRAVSVDVVANRYVVGSHPVVQLNIRDISPRKEAARLLHESEERFRVVVESVRDYAIFQMDSEGRILTWNAGAERLLGWREREILGKSVSTVFTPEDIERGEPERELSRARVEGRAQDERWHMRKDGSRFFATGVLTRAPGEVGSGLAYMKIMQDITTRKEQEERLKRSVEEKSVLVREIHHRVKNNLQMIGSLLSLQRDQMQDEQARQAFEETEDRIRAIARIHEQLYESDDLREIEVGAYLDGLARELVSLYATVPDGVRLEVEAPEMLLPIDKAIPLGLIANELILNSLKHGLKQQAGDLRVALAFDGAGSEGGTTDGWAQLRVEDSGPGLPCGIDVKQAQSMGYRLVNLLIRQLRGNLEIRQVPGASVSVLFPLTGPKSAGKE